MRANSTGSFMASSHIPPAVMASRAAAPQASSTAYTRTEPSPLKPEPPTVAADLRPMMEPEPPDFDR